jgi:sulfur relay (sulfurtransferase) DsrC/TusE family protein
MAKKAPERRFRTRRGPKRDPSKWDLVEWIEDRAAIIAERKGSAYGAKKLACAEYVRRFFPRDRQTAEAVDRLYKSYKNATDEWRITERKLDKARDSYSPLATRRRPK